MISVKLLCPGRVEEFATEVKVAKGGTKKEEEGSPHGERLALAAARFFSRAKATSSGSRCDPRRSRILFVRPKRMRVTRGSDDEQRARGQSSLAYAPEPTALVLFSLALLRPIGNPSTGEVAIRSIRLPTVDLILFAKFTLWG